MGELVDCLVVDLHHSLEPRTAVVNDVKQAGDWNRVTKVHGWPVGIRGGLERIMVFKYFNLQGKILAKGTGRIVGIANSTP